MNYLEYISEAARKIRMKRAETIQYYHDVLTGFTVAVNVDFTRQDLEDLIFKQSQQLDIDIGFAYKHPKDNYNHATGRSKSWSDIKKHKFCLTNISVDKETHKLTYTLASHDERNGHIMIDLRTSLKSSKPHFILCTSEKAFTRSSSNCNIYF